MKRLVDGMGKLRDFTIQSLRLNEIITNRRAGTVVQTPEEENRGYIP